MSAGSPRCARQGTRDKDAGKLALTCEGLSFIRRSQVLAGAFIADVSATFFALPLSLFPAINAERFGGDPRILGLMPAAIGVGGMLTAVLAGPVRHVSRHGLAMIVCRVRLGLVVRGVRGHPVAVAHAARRWRWRARPTRTPWCSAR